MPDDIIVACVCVGDRYSPEYVHRLRDGVRRHLDRPHRFLCLSDTRSGYPFMCEPSARGEGWWAKMRLFKRPWRAGRKVLYLDLDTVIVGDLAPIVDLNVNFGIAYNFAREAGRSSWPCQFNSSVMLLGPDLDDSIWRRFHVKQSEFKVAYERYGDQKAIEDLAPTATLLQPLLPKGYMTGYRHIAGTTAPPANCSIVVFGGNHKPDNCPLGWVKDHWR